MTKLSSLIPTFNIFIMAPGEQEEPKAPPPSPVIMEKNNDKLLKALLEKNSRVIEKKFDALNRNVQSIGKRRQEPNNHSMLTEMLQTHTATLSELMNKLSSLPRTSHVGGG